MLKNEKLDELSSLLEKMTQPDPKWLLIMKRLPVLFVMGFSVITLTLFHLNAWWRPELTTSEFDNALLVIVYLFAILLLFLLMTPLAHLLYIMWHRKQFAPYLFSKDHGLQRDAIFIERLLEFDKATLAYGLLQYRHKQLFPERLATASLGDLRKLGLLPACLALFISLGSTTWLKEDK